MNQLNRTISSFQEQQQVAKQEEAGNVTITILHLKNGKIERRGQFQDLTLSKTSPFEYVAETFHRGSVNHYYEGMESHPADYYKGEETMAMINKTTAEIEASIQAGVRTIAIVYAESRKKITHTKAVMDKNAALNLLK